MRILINDLVQYSDAPESLKSAALADDMQATSITINFPESVDIDCIGIGHCMSDSVTVNGEQIILDQQYRRRSGLYMLSRVYSGAQLTIVFPQATTIGRIGAGKARQIGSAPAREPGFWSTATNRRTLSAQVIPGAGGVDGRYVNVDFRYKIDREFFQDLEDAYPSQISRGFPFFLDFTDCGTENHPWKTFYGSTDSKMLFQSSVNKFAYSKKFKFTEAY